MNVFETFAVAVSSTDSGYDARAALTSVVLALGFDSLESGRLWTRESDGEVLISHLSAELPTADLYLRKKAYLHDPLVARALASPGVFAAHFDELDLDLELMPPQMRVVFDAARATGQSAKLIMSVRDPDQSTWIFAATGDMPRARLYGILEKHRAGLHMAACLVVDRLRPPEARLDRGPCLTKRESDVLQHLAAGLRTDAICDALSISKSTIEMHVRNARRKLGASTREQAVAAALGRGEISL